LPFSDLVEEMGEKSEKIKVKFDGENLVVTDRSGIDSLASRGYGVKESDRLILAPYEVLYLLSKEVVEVIGPSSEILEFKDVLDLFKSRDENLWVRYLMYRDLRSRGYVVREGFGLGIDFRVYERGTYGEKPATYLIYGIQEGKPVSIGDLSKTLAYTQNLKKKLILAVLSRRGEVVYYSLSKLTFSK